MKTTKLKCGYIFIENEDYHPPLKKCKCFTHTIPLEEVELTELEKAIYEVS